MNQALQLYNTLSRQVEPFEPLEPGKVRLYACGPTVYARAHLGNMRTYIFVDTLRRVLEFAGYDVQHVMNITDVGHLTDDGDEGEDKLQKRAAQEKKTAWDLAAQYEEIFFQDMAALNILTPKIICRATDHITEQVQMIRQLEKKGLAYPTKDGIYFDTAKFEDYGKMARLDLEGLRGGERVDLGDKRGKTDFALWKFSPKDQLRDMEWQSPWGTGFPGWHIECSAMARHFLGDVIDIHTGGTDHIPVHHTNEIAQSEGATGQKPFVRFWIHGAFLILGEEGKISKSAGHDFSVEGLVKDGYDPLAFRYLLLTAHYRNFLHYDPSAMQGPQKALDRLRAQCQQLGYNETVKAQFTGPEAMQQLKKIAPEMTAALLDDLNSARALVAFRKYLADPKASGEEKQIVIRAMDDILGLDFAAQKEQDVEHEQLSAALLALLEARNAARSAKNWAEADRLRDLLAQEGYSVIDQAGGSKLVPNS